MKRFLSILFFHTIFLSIFAQSPEIPLFRAFDGRYNDAPGARIYEVRQKNNYYYSIDVKDNREIINRLQEWANETEKLANSVSRSVSNGDNNIILYISDRELNVGINYPSDNSRINIFLQSTRPFMEDDIKRQNHK